MKRRNPFAVFVFSIITLGIYSIVWYVSTKGEMNRKGASIPSAWLLILPFVDIYWIWKFSQGVNHVTRGGSSAGATFLLLFLLGPIGMAVVQSELNSNTGESIASVAAAAGKAGS
jgi:hypothetical protein